MEELHKIDVVGSPFEIFLQENVNRGFKDERIIDSDGPNTFLETRDRMLEVDRG